MLASAGSLAQYLALPSILSGVPGYHFAFCWVEEEMLAGRLGAGKGRCVDDVMFDSTEICVKQLADVSFGAPICERWSAPMHT